jgi:pimeloyl-ACP methyl ester carboxylesterase
MDTHFATSSDGTHIAYDVTGSGPGLVLLHGGGQDRQAWHKAGWTERLTGHFCVIAIDIRGHGESAKPTDPAAYSIDRLCEDILVVADAAGAQRFSLWGYSYGGNIGRYLAARSDRVERFAIIGVPFGPSADDNFRRMIQQMQQRWKPVMDADRAGTLDVAQIPEKDRPAWRGGQVKVVLAWLGALLEWPPVEPADIRCPTLWLVGTANATGMQGVTRYKGKLDGTRVRVALVEGLTHPEELDKVDQVLPMLLEFMSRE